MTTKIPVHRCGPGGCRWGMYHRADAVVVGYALVDDCDAHLARYFWTTKNGYVRRWDNKRRDVMLHHEIIGKPPPGWHTSHADANKLNNQRSNLSHVTHSQNFLNIHDPLLNSNTTGERGIDFDAHTTSRNKWRGKVTIQGRVYRTRRCASQEEASEAMKEMRRRLGVLLPIGEQA